MAATLREKWQFALLATLLYLTAPLFNAAYYITEEGPGAYPPHADTIAIPIYYFAIGVALFSPFYAAAVWLATRYYQVAFRCRFRFAVGLFAAVFTLFAGRKRRTAD